jgi:hypothetical protein
LVNNIYIYIYMAKSRKHKLKNFRKKSRKVKTRRKYKKRTKKPTRKHPRRRKKRTMRAGVVEWFRRKRNKPKKNDDWGGGEELGTPPPVRGDHRLDYELNVWMDTLPKPQPDDVMEVYRLIDYYAKENYSKRLKWSESEHNDAHADAKEAESARLKERYDNDDVWKAFQRKVLHEVIALLKMRYHHGYNNNNNNVMHAMVQLDRRIKLKISPEEDALREAMKDTNLEGLRNAISNFNTYLEKKSEDMYASALHSRFDMGFGHLISIYEPALLLTGGQRATRALDALEDNAEQVLLKKAVSLYFSRGGRLSPLEAALRKKKEEAAAEEQAKAAAKAKKEQEAAAAKKEQEVDEELETARVVAAAANTNSSSSSGASSRHTIKLSDSGGDLGEEEGEETLESDEEEEEQVEKELQEARAEAAVTGSRGTAGDDRRGGGTRRSERAVPIN